MTNDSKPLPSTARLSGVSGSAHIWRAYPSPTDATYAELQWAFDHFNERLFEGQLPLCLFTLQRDSTTCGYFSHRRFVSSTGDGRFTDEITLNPAYFASLSLLDILQTIVHEMVHQWQAHFGKPGRARYHNRQFAEKMEAIGLMPSSTGKPGGAKTGEKLAAYVIEGGPFLAAARELETAAFGISWGDRHYYDIPTDANVAANAAISERVLIRCAEPRTKKPTRVKYHCAETGENVWGRPGMELFSAAGDGETFYSFAPV